MGSAENEESATQISETTKSSSLFRYNSPLAQIILIGLVCFYCPGMFNALSGMGGGGQVNATYVLYVGSFLYYNHKQHQPFAIIASVVLGIGAGLLWAAQGAIMTSYPPVNQKGTYISIFWSIFNMGGVIDGLIPFILNYNSGDKAATVNDGTYIGFMAFMSLGTVLSLTILPASKVVRDDGTKCTNMLYSNVATEIMEILKLFYNWKMLLIFIAKSF